MNTLRVKPGSDLARLVERLRTQKLRHQPTAHQIHGGHWQVSWCEEGADQNCGAYFCSTGKRLSDEAAHRRYQRAVDARERATSREAPRVEHDPDEEIPF